jgi:hypothetical protein
MLEQSLAYLLIQVNQAPSRLPHRITFAVCAGKAPGHRIGPGIKGLRRLLRP